MVDVRQTHFIVEMYSVYLQNLVLIGNSWDYC